MSSTNARIRTDAKWINGPVVTGAEMSALDGYTVTLINGDEGGSWSLGANIDLLGAGMWLTAGSNTIVGSHARVSGDIIHADNDYLVLEGGHTGGTRTISSSAGGALFPIGWAYVDTQAAIASTSIGALASIPLRVHNGATFTQVVFSFIVSASHSGVPTVLPQFRVVKVDAGGVRTPLVTNGAVGYVSFSPQPANTAAWIAASAAQTLTYILDGNVIVDTAKYTYFAEIIDESGTYAIAGNIYTDVVSTMGAIPDMRPQ